MDGTTAGLGCDFGKPKARDPGPLAQGVGTMWPQCDLMRSVATLLDFSFRAPEHPLSAHLGPIYPDSIYFVRLLQSGEAFGIPGYHRLQDEHVTLIGTMSGGSS